MISLADDLHIQAYFAGARVAGGERVAPFARPLSPSELECWREGFLEHRADHEALLASDYVRVWGSPLPILLPPCQGEAADAPVLRPTVPLPAAKDPDLTVRCPCPPTAPGQPVVRSPECLEHPSGNRWLARAIVLGARATHPCGNGVTVGCCPAGCSGCDLFRLEARTALETAGCIESTWSSSLAPDDLRGAARLEDPTQPSTSSAAGLDPYGTPALAAKVFAQRAEVPEHVPAGLYGGSVSVVTEPRTSVRSRPPAHATATPAPAPAITLPGGSAVPVPAAVPPPADAPTRRRRGRAAA